MYAYTFFIVFLALKVHVTSEDVSKMVITYGELSELDSCELVESGDCFSVCWSNENCTIAYLDDETCYNCVNVTYITKLDSGTSKVGFKTNSTTCSEYPNITYYNENYRLAYTDDTWTMEYIGWRCEDNYQLFQRTKAMYCLTVVQSTVKYAGANAVCQKNGDTLSGIENANEQLWVQEQCWTLPETQIDRTYLLIDGYLNQAAVNAKLANNNYVCKYSSQYTFYDTTLSNPVNRWYANNPDCYQGKERCLYMYTHNDTTDPLDGLLGDMVCAENNTLTLCGKLAYYGY